MGALNAILAAVLRVCGEIVLGWIDRWQSLAGAETKGAAEADARANASTAASERRAAEVAPVTEDEAIDRLESGRL